MKPLILFVASSLCLCAAAPFLEKTRLIEQSADGFASPRIPAVAATTKGTLLVFVVGRREVSDHGESDIILFRSLDNGKNWLPYLTVKKGEGGTVDNPVPIVDRDSGRLTLLFQRNYEKVFQIHSDDEGATWSEPEDITAVFETFKKEYPWGHTAPGPGHGIQLRDGRFVVPVWMSAAAERRPQAVSTIFSDDRRKTWRTGEILKGDIGAMNESNAAQLDNGAVIIFSRNKNPAYRYARAQSPDGAGAWSKPVLVEDLYSVFCFGSVARVDDGAGTSALVFCAPDSRPDMRTLNKRGNRPRENLTLRLSRDGGKTWPLSKKLEAGRAAYSDIVQARDGALLCAYESGKNAQTKNANTTGITVARFNLEWLTQGECATSSPTDKHPESPRP